MASRVKKIRPDELDEHIGEVDNTYMIVSDPDAAKTSIGETVYVRMPQFSRRLRLLRLEQFAKGLLSEERVQAGEYILDSGIVLCPNKTFALEMTPEIKDLLKKGILAGGGRGHGVAKAPMVTHCLLDEEKERRENYDTI